MKPEEFEVYIIPPNFMEGGTLFGGLLKTRNTIEAVILGLAVGVPVLRLPFSLTVRVVILCLTALPLVLLALIGVRNLSRRRNCGDPRFSAGRLHIYSCDARFHGADTGFSALQRCRRKDLHSCHRSQELLSLGR